MVTRDVQLGDVVQISPKAANRLAGCLAQVEKVHGWGVTAWVGWPEIPHPLGSIVMIRVDGMAPEWRAYVRLA